MASSHDGGGPQKQSSATQSSNRDGDPPSPPPPTTSYPNQTPPGQGCPQPHMNYYPPTMGYPPNHGGQPYPYQQRYGPYTNEYPQPQGYNYHQAPSYYSAPTPPHSPHGVGFLRGFILCSCILFTMFFFVSLVVAMVLRPHLPIYKVVSFSVANFSTDTALTGDWDAKFTIENPNDKELSSFTKFKVDVLYNSGVTLIASNTVPGVDLDQRQLREFEVKASSNPGNQMALKKPTMEEMGKERGGGSVTFDLRISSAVSFVSSSMSTRRNPIDAFCEGLKVVFQNNTGTGTLDNGGKPIECTPYV